VGKIKHILHCFWHNCNLH